MIEEVMPTLLVKWNVTWSLWPMTSAIVHRNWPAGLTVALWGSTRVNETSTEEADAAATGRMAARAPITHLTDDIDGILSLLTAIFHRGVVPREEHIPWGRKSNG